MILQSAILSKAPILGGDAGVGKLVLRLFGAALLLMAVSVRVQRLDQVGRTALQDFCKPTFNEQVFGCRGKSVETVRRLWGFVIQTNESVLQ